MSVIHDLSEQLTQTQNRNVELEQILKCKQEEILTLKELLSAVLGMDESKNLEKIKEIVIGNCSSKCDNDKILYWPD